MSKLTLVSNLEALSPTELKALVVSQHELIVSRDSEIEQLKLLIAKLRRMQFGRSSEKLDRQIEQLELRLEALQQNDAEKIAATPEKIASVEAVRSARRPLPAHLPRKQKTCPDCGGELRKLGEAVEAGQAYEFLASGIGACLENAGSLAEEFSCLASHGFNARAQFVMATALEELGKTLILFDFVRVGWEKREWIAALCRAFYHHLKKSAYARIIRWPGSGALLDALMMFKIELIEYWPNRDPESGEPDEFANGIVSREWGLYVDWDDVDGRWFSPIKSTLAHYYAQEEELDGKRIGEERIEKILSALLRANREGLFVPEALKTVHGVMSKLYVTATTPENKIIDILTETAKRLSDMGTKLSDETIKSNFMCYPLYSAILTPEQTKGYWEM